MFEEYYDQFMPSKQMREYLKKVQVEPWNVINMVYGSPCKLTSKLKALKRLRRQGKNMDEGMRKDWFLEEIDDCILNIEESVKCLALPGIYSVENGMFSEYNLTTDVCLETLCYTYNGAMQHIKRFEDGFRDYDPDGLRWYELTKWVKNAEGKLCEVCNYVIVRNELWYSELDHDYCAANKINRIFFDTANLNLPVPFKAGDIVEIDGFPYGPKIRMLICQVGDNHDCCCLQAIYRRQDGIWDSGAVKHGRIAYVTYPQVSALYTAHLYEGELPEEEQLLLRIKEYLAGDENKYWEFWEKRIAAHEPITDADIVAYLDAIHR